MWALMKSRPPAAASSPVAALFACLFLSAPCCIGEQPGAVAVVTDRSALPASPYFSVPNQFKLSGTGDVFFTSGLNTGLFHWNHVTGVRTRLLQTNDPIEILGLDVPPEEAEAMAGSRLQSPAVSGTLQANASGQAAMLLVAAIPGQRDPAGVFVYDGTAYRFVEEADPAGTVQVLLNDLGRVALRTNDGEMNNGSVVIAIETPGGVVEVAETGYPTPLGGRFNGLQIIGFNNAGTVAFLADIGGGTSSRAVFLANGVDPPVPIARSGESASGLGRFNLRSNIANYFFNAAGEVAFATDVTGGGLPGIWVARESSPTVKVARLGEPCGIPGWGNNIAPLNLRGLTASGQVLWDTNLSGPPGHALFVNDPAGGPNRAVFYQGQEASPGRSFVRSQQAVVSPAGQIAFLASLTGGSPLGWYFASSSGPAAEVALEGQPAPAGGRFGFAGRNMPASINNAGQFVFLADILDLNAVALFSWSGAGISPVMSTRDQLPRGANTVLGPLPASAGDSEVLFRVSKAGGRPAYYAKPSQPGMSGIRRLFAEFDEVPGVGTIVSPGSVLMNSKGDVAFTCVLLGGDVYPSSGLLGGTSSAQIEGIVITGDAAPGGGRFAWFSGLQINDQPQVAFFAGTDLPDQSGIFIATKSPPGLEAVVRQNHPSWPWPTGGLFGALGAAPRLSASGQVAFRANGPSGAGLFLGAGGSSPIKAALTGEPAPGGGTFSTIPSTFVVNGVGQIAYLSLFTGGGGGVFLSSCESGVCATQRIARDAEPAPGTGGMFGYHREDSILLNDSGTVAFWAGLRHDTPTPQSPWTGWFTATPDGISPRLLHMQALPGGGNAGMVPPGAGLAALAESGEMCIFLASVYGGDEPRLVIADAEGDLRHFAASGETAAGTGSVLGALNAPVKATPAGGFYFVAALTHGPARAGIFRNRPE